MKAKIEKREKAETRTRPVEVVFTFLERVRRRVAASSQEYQTLTNFPELAADDAADLNHRYHHLPIG